MKIAFISAMSGHAWGGSEILWSLAAHRLLKKGHSVFCSVPHWPEVPEPIFDLIQVGATVNRRKAPARIKFHQVLAKMQGIPRHRSKWTSAWNHIVRFQPNLVCISHGSATCGIEWMSRCLDAGIPYVSVAQALSEQWWPHDSQAEEIIRAYQGALCAFFVSHANLHLWEMQLGIRLPNGEVVFNPCQVNRDACPPWPEENDMVRLACVGRLEPAAKGQDLLFEVMAMPKWRERNLVVSLYGKGPCEQGLRRLSEMLGLEGKIEFAGHVDHVEDIWRRNHALVLPSRYEGLPLCLVEAMLCGRPSIVTDASGNREPLKDNVTGFIAESPTVRHLDEAMERAWSRRADWRSIGVAAANSIRHQIPEDAAEAFAARLIALADRIN